MPSITEYYLNRQLGTVVPLEKTICRSIYTRLRPSNDAVESTADGGIFALQFSPNGSSLYLARESGSLDVHDPLRSRSTLISSITAHPEPVNHIKFYNDHLLATASDDTTVRLWDSRLLKTPIATVEGHKSWVKNIEFDGQYMITAGFDDHIMRTDMNDLNSASSSIGHVKGLTRMVLTGDRQTMLLSTMLGQLLLVREIEYSTLEECLREEKTINGKNTMVEVTDFGDLDREYISSMCPHPFFNIAASRMSERMGEATCIHSLSTRRLLSWSSEPTSARGLIKEQCWSMNGRLLASPYAYGARVFSFDDDCSLWSDRVRSPLHELITLIGHKSPVLAVRFSPTHEALLVSGCMNGTLVVHQPR